MRVLRRFWAFVRPYRGKFFLTICLLFLSVPLAQFALFLTRDVTNQALLAANLTADERWATVLRIVGLQAIFFLSSAVLSTWREVLEWYGAMRATFDVRLAFYKHLHRLPLSFLARRLPGEHLFRSTTDMVSVFRVANRPAAPTASGQSPPESKEVAMAIYSNDVDPYDPGLMGMIVRTVPMIIETLYSLAWGAALLFLIDPVLSLCLILYIVPFTLVSQRLFNRVRKTAFAFKERSEVEAGVLRDSIAGLRTLKSFGRLNYQLKRYMHSVIDARRRGIQQISEIVLTQNVAQMGMKWAFSMSIYLYVTIRVMQGKSTIGDWVVTFLLIEAAQAPLENFVQLLQLVKMQLVPAQRVLETLDQEPAIVDPPNAPKIPEVSGRVQFKDVQFSYSDVRPALNGISLTIEPGTYVGIVGPSGAGKSSLIALLLRLYQPQSGAILVDGHDVGQIQLQSLLDQVGTVPQSTYLYSGSILDNILFGDPWASEEDLARAIADSGVDRFAARFPEGLETELGEGATISGGERQRIGIARALVRNPRILVLDEATANLDPETEESVLRSIDVLRQGRTVLSVAHRLKAVMRCDQIVVLEEGRVSQTGSHAELISAPGPYQTLWREQMHDSEEFSEVKP
ncbi:MAG: ABC transporter ATP-binding protein [Chlorobia bacterium]|nr:ABC transporter ATP-binding protein [Fimbriimonadaceae bacterium]